MAKRSLEIRVAEKEKQLEEYKKQYNLEEEKVLDEISTSKFSK